MYLGLFFDTILIHLFLAVLLATIFYLLPNHGINVFALTQDHLWGIFTSWLVHGEERHLHSNIIGLLTSVFLLIILYSLAIFLIQKLSNISVRRVVIRLKTALIAVLISSQVLPSAYLYFAGKVQGILCGASLLVYGINGMYVPVLFLLLVLMLAIIEKKVKKPSKLKIRTLNAFQMLLLASLLTLLILVSHPVFSGFVGASTPGASALGHSLAFIIGAYTSMLFMAVLVFEIFEECP